MKAETRELLHLLESSENAMLFMDGWMVPLWSWLESERGKEQIAKIQAAGKQVTLAGIVPAEVHGMPSADWLRKYRLTILPVVAPASVDPAAPLPAPAVQKLMFGLKEPKPRRK